MGATNKNNKHDPSSSLGGKNGSRDEKTRKKEEKEQRTHEARSGEDVIASQRRKVKRKGKKAATRKHKRNERMEY